MTLLSIFSCKMSRNPSLRRRYSRVENLPPMFTCSVIYERWVEPRSTFAWPGRQPTLLLPDPPHQQPLALPSLAQAQTQWRSIVAPSLSPPHVAPDNSPERATPVGSPDIELPSVLPERADLA